MDELYGDTNTYTQLAPISSDISWSVSDKGFGYNLMR